MENKDKGSMYMDKEEKYFGSVLLGFGTLLVSLSIYLLFVFSLYNNINSSRLNKAS